MKYYLLRQNTDKLSKWFLGDIDYMNNWLFRDPPVELMEPATFSVAVKSNGSETDFTLAGYASVPVVSERFVDSLSGLPEIDEPFFNVVFNPVEFSNYSSQQKYFVMVVETQLDCVDETKSEFTKFGKDDPVRPDLEGEYSGFYNLIIDSTRAKNKHVFRLKSYLGALIVSEEIKDRLESAKVNGIQFSSVNGDTSTVV